MEVPRVEKSHLNHVPHQKKKLSEDHFHIHETFMSQLGLENPSAENYYVLGR